MTASLLSRLSALMAVLLGIASAAPAQDRTPVVLAAAVLDGAPVVSGQPAVVFAAACPRDPSATVALAPASEWAASFRLVVRDAAGQEHLWPFAYATGPEGAVVLDGDCHAGWAWTLTPEATATLPQGRYTLAAELSADGLAVPLRTSPVPLSVLPAPAPTPQTEARRLLRLADFETVRKRPAEARAHIEVLISQQPGHAEGRLRQAEALAAEGRPVEALLAIEAAVEALPSAVLEGAEPPAALLVARAAYIEAAERSTVFVVTHQPKSADHPTAGQGSAGTFVLDGVEGREPVLHRGTTYTFRMDGVSASSPFYLTTNAAGAGADPYTAGVDGAPASADGVLTFTPGPDAPTVLHYASTTEPHAGWRLHIEDAAPTADEPPPSQPDGGPVVLALSAPAPNPTAGQARFTVSVAHTGPVRAEVFDVLGRRVATLYDGQAEAGERLSLLFDAGSLPSGPYVVRATSGTAHVVRRVTVAH